MGLRPPVAQAAPRKEKRCPEFRTPFFFAGRSLCDGRPQAHYSPAGRICPVKLR